ncbi:hypothetical protein AB0B66_35620 [Catellatospora sp. NPDC049111]|uniref:hypothetical protein n=1 Tax=Catellatospora sp. NPDC049111 TaxID=3155271 RepID=UPI00340133A0
MSSYDPRLSTHVTILRWIVGGLAAVYLLFFLIATAALGGLTFGWSTTALPAFLGSAVLSAAIYLPAAPLAARIRRSDVARLYTVTAIRTWGALMMGQFGLVFVFALDVGLTPLLLGGTATVALLAFGVWPRPAVLLPPVATA